MKRSVYLVYSYETYIPSVIAVTKTLKQAKKFIKKVMKKRNITNVVFDDERYDYTDLVWDEDINAFCGPGNKIRFRVTKERVKVIKS